MSQNQSKSLRTVILIGLFASICYVSLYFKIPIPSPVGTPFLHMGNMFVILAALLFTGPIGGLAGSIGMGLFDIFNGFVSSAFKTFVLKFGIGICVGLVASKGHKKDAKSPLKLIIIAATCFITAGVVLLITALNMGAEITIPGVEKALVINPVLYIFCLLLGIGLGITCFFIRKISVKMQYAVLGAVSGIAFNIVGEFLFVTIKLILAGSAVIPALLAGLVNLPATVINGSASIVIALILYPPLAKVIQKSGFKF